MSPSAVLSIDEGTTGTRSALVHSDGTVDALEYRRLRVKSPRAGVVEQDANEILERTVEVIKSTMAQARERGIQVGAIAIATQRSTAVLWDSQTGRAVGPAMVWQDTRYSAEIAELAETWDAELVQNCGRPTGVRSVYLWAAHLLRENDEVAELHRAGRLRFGTIDSWLLWSLAVEKRVLSSATNATAAAAFRLRENRYHEGYITALGFPLGLLPEIVQDGEFLGTGNPAIFGAEIPIMATIGDQHAAIIGLGCIDRGKAMVVHGTGSFCDLITGEKFPENPGLHEGTLVLTGWRTGGVSTYTVETYTSTTGSAFDWFCEQLGWFDNAKQITEYAARTDTSNGVLFIPALTGIRVPFVDPRVRASLSGVSTATTKADVAHALLEGVAHFVRSSLECNSVVAGMSPDEVVVGGGMSASDPLIQIQADFTGTPMRRRQGADKASLRGAAFLAGSSGLIWSDLHEATSTLDPGELFEPVMSEDERLSIASHWRGRIDRELSLVKELS